MHGHQVKMYGNGGRQEKKSQTAKGRRICLMTKIILLTFALLSGVVYSVNVHQNHIIPTEKCEIITLSQIGRASCRERV